MNRNILLKSLVFGLAILLATSALASNKGSLNLHEAVQINGQALPAGNYQLRWDGTGANVELSILQGKKVVTKTSARVVQLDKPSAYDSAVVDNASGSPTISQVRFEGKKYALAFGDKAETSENSGMK